MPARFNAPRITDVITICTSAFPRTPMATIDIIWVVLEISNVLQCYCQGEEQEILLFLQIYTAILASPSR